MILIISYFFNMGAGFLLYVEEEQEEESKRRMWRRRARKCIYMEGRMREGKKGGNEG